MNHQNTNTSDQVVVCSASGMLQALVIQEALQKVGIPVTLKYDTSHYSGGSSSEVNIVVPNHCVTEARALLNPRPRYGEIFCVPGLA